LQAAAVARALRFGTAGTATGVADISIAIEPATQ
jgi:hypothetical protein